jgi:hypothetical protein
MQLDFTLNLKFDTMKFGQEKPKQMTHGSKSTNLPFCINDPHAFMLIVKKLKVN